MDEGCCARGWARAGRNDREPKIGRGQVKRSVIASIPAAGINVVFRMVGSSNSPTSP
jgi:hypothetical protein